MRNFIEQVVGVQIFEARDISQVTKLVEEEKESLTLRLNFFGGS